MRSMYGSGKPRAAHDGAIQAILTILAVIKAIEDLLHFDPRTHHCCVVRVSRRSTPAVRCFRQLENGRFRHGLLGVSVSESGVPLRRRGSAIDSVKITQTNANSPVQPPPFSRARAPPNPGNSPRLGHFTTHPLRRRSLRPATPGSSRVILCVISALSPRSCRVFHLSPDLLPARWSSVHGQ
jgi:hypothetical protein